VAGGILLLAVVTAAAGYPGPALIITGVALLRVAIGIVMDRRASAPAWRSPEPDPRSEAERVFARALEEHVVGADDFVEAARMRETSRRDGP
jgi:hypothetical protein